MLYALAVFAPLVGSLIALLFGRQIGDRAAQTVTIAGMVLASICGVSSFVDLIYSGVPAGVISLGTWVEAGSFHVEWALRYDALSAVMVAMVTCVATLIHIYSAGYMAHDNTIWKFFSYLSLFTFAMLMLVTADNLLQLFFGWEGVGLASYLLIGYYYDRPSAGAAAMKAFIVNRVGDLGFALGIALLFMVFGTISFDGIFAAVSQHQNDSYHLFGTDFRALEVIGVLLFIGAMGKSAQLGLHVWLPDAMEGPTPVSALIHAATMVTAGVFLMARMSPLMEYAPYALGFVCFMGASTALFAATIGCVQNDIKRVIAYSTCSQLGYMFIAAGVGAYQASVFHLLTHAFFKALLFLSAGSVIHAMSEEQDIRKMGGIWKKIPLTYTVMFIGSLALGGVYPFAGYYSKDAILEAAYAAHSSVGAYGFWCGLIAAGLTAFYSWRLLILTFHGPRARKPVGDDRAADPARRRRRVGRSGVPRTTARRALGTFLGREHQAQPCQQGAGTYGTRARLGQPGAERDRPGRHRARLHHLYGHAGTPGPRRRRLWAAVPLPAQQVVFRRTLQRHHHPPVALLGARPVAGR